MAEQKVIRCSFICFAFHMDYKQEKVVHISGLLADLMNQKPVTGADFAALEGKILLILPDHDFFSGEMQKDLIKLICTLRKLPTFQAGIYQLYSKRTTIFKPSACS